MRVAFVTMLVLTALVLSACGGGSAAEPAGEGAADTVAEAEDTPEPTKSGRIVPTMPAAQFAAPTSMIDATKVAGTGSTPEAVEVDVALGGEIYSRLCNECHGEALQGVSGKAQPIEAYELDDVGLTDLLRTGGGFGNEHLFGLDKVSPEGIASLQAHLATLGQ